ncbi:MAG TPA: arsenite efflux transporter metallochaperone ArsD [Coriobacteriia bacterium]
MTARLQVYDPPMCCSTGVCGPTVDPDLIRFARDLAWLRHHDVTVERFNLAQEPGAFVENATILATLKAKGAECLPIVLVDGEPVVGTGYPMRQRLLELLNPKDGE